MKFKANHDIVIGKPPKPKTVHAGELMPAGLPMAELQRLADLGAITGVAEAADGAAGGPGNDTGDGAGNGNAPSVTVAGNGASVTVANNQG